MVHELLEGLDGGDVAEVMEHLVPESGIEQVEHGVFGSANVEVDVSPIRVGLFGDEAFIIIGIAVTQVIPAGTRPLGHGVGLAGDTVGQIHPVGGFAQQGIRSAAGLVVVEGRGQQGQLFFAQGLVFAVLPDDGEGLAPVALTREQPVAQLVLNLAAAFAFVL